MYINLKHHLSLSLELGIHHLEIEIVSNTNIKLYYQLQSVYDELTLRLQTNSTIASDKDLFSSTLFFTCEFDLLEAFIECYCTMLQHKTIKLKREKEN